MSKRIILTVTNDLTYDRRMQRICRTLAEAGYQVELVGRKRPHSIPTTDEPYRQTRLQCWLERGKGFYMEYNVRLFIYLLKRRFHAVCGVDLDTLLPARLVSWIKRKPCFYDAHEYFPEVPELTHRPLTRMCWVWAEKLLLLRITGGYTVCQNLADIYNNAYHKDLLVIRNMPTRRVALPNQKPGDYILYQGVLNVGRGLPELITAMQQVDAPLWLAGEGDISDELRQLARDLDLTHKVRFLGYLRPAELQKVTAGAKLGLNPVENRGKSHYYSLANKFFDYVQAEIPQVTMDFPEYRLLNDKYRVALLIDRPDDTTLQHAINRLLHDSTLYGQLRENARKAAAEWHWEREAPKLVEFYRQTVGSA